MNTKSIFTSTGVLGGAVTSVLFLVAGAMGFHLDKAQTLGLIEALKEVLPMLVGAGSALVVIWSRIKHVDFDKVNVPGAVAALLALASAFGIDVHDIQHLVGTSDELMARLPGIIASLVSLYGVIRAKKAIAVKRADVVPMLIACTLPLSSCSQFSRLPPDTQDAVKQAAIIGAQVAADAVTKAIVAAITKQLEQQAKP